MTNTKDIASKLSVAFVAVAMIFTAFASTAKAQTTEDLQKMINDLLAQVAALQSQTGAATTAAGVCPYTWTRDLSTGATGADVKMLQMFLNADADTRVAVEGAGSAGMETEYYGPATAAAVSKLQVKYRSEVLSPANLVNPTGYFGPGTRAKANSLCVAAPVVDTDEDMDSDEDMDEDEDMTLGGEASLDKFEMDSASDDELEEGAEDAEIAEATLEFVDGDAEISRIDVQLLGSAETDTSSVRPWDAFETISLWVDGDMVAEENADDEDDYLDEDEGTLRFSGLHIVGMEDEELEITIAATVQTGLDTEELTTWTVGVVAVRFFDADGVATTEDSMDDIGTDGEQTFTVDEAGSEDELKAKTSSNDPDASTLQVNDDKKSDWYTVFVFDLDTDDSVNDIELNSIKINASTTLAAYSTLVDDVELVIDGVTIDDVSVASGSSLVIPAVLTFDVDGDVVIDAGDRVEAELMVRFKSIASTSEGATIKASIDALDTTIVSAEGADDLGDSQLSGAATGDAHTLRTAGIDVSPVSTDADVTVNDGATDDYATFEIEVEVTAFEQDVYLSTDPATSTSWSLVNGSGATVSAGTSTVVLTSSADEVGGFFEITEGETETVTITVTYVPGVANTAARLVLNSLSFDEDQDTTPDQTQSTLPVTDYRTSVVTIVN